MVDKSLCSHTSHTKVQYCMVKIGSLLNFIESVGAVTVRHFLPGLALADGDVDPSPSGALGASGCRRATSARASTFCPTAAPSTFPGLWTSGSVSTVGAGVGIQHGQTCRLPRRFVSRLY
jgi:hypothetical protein